MATSGSIDFSLNARDIVEFALEEIRVTSSGDAVSAEDMATGIRRLNLMLKSWQSSAPSLWRQTEGSVVLTTAASYALSPRPFRVIECRYRDTAARDLPMNELTRSEYYDLPLKTSTGIPTNYYVDYQRTAATLYVWPVMSSATTETIKYTYQRAFEDIDAATNDLDIPAEHLETVGTNLAVRLLSPFGKSERDNQMLIATARGLLLDMQDADREAVVRFIPGR